MNKSLKILFFLKKRGNYRQGPISIYLRITIDGKKCELTTQRSCESSKWNQIKDRIQGSKPHYAQFNAYLDTLQGKIFEIQKEHELKNEPLSAEIIKQKLLGLTKEQQHTLIEVFKYHNEQMFALVEKE